MKKQAILLSLLTVLIPNTLTPNYLTDIFKYAFPAARSIFVSQSADTYNVFVEKDYPGLKTFLLRNGLLTGALLMGGGLLLANDVDKGELSRKNEYVRNAAGFLALASAFGGFMYMISSLKCDINFSNVIQPDVIITVTR